jgi:hypothetical protein
MDFDELFAQVLEAFQREQRISYRALRRRFDLSDDDLEDLKIEIVEAKQLAIDENDRILVWSGEPGVLPSVHEPTAPPTTEQEREPLSYTPQHLAEKILTSRSAIEAAYIDGYVIHISMGKLSTNAMIETDTRCLR